MDRKKAFTTAEAVNPLQRMLGTRLRLERSRLGFSSAEIANKLGLSDTYLRLAESGRAMLNQGLVFKIIETFADSISFNRLALFMVGTHWVGVEMAAYSGKHRGKRAVEALALNVSDFQSFNEKTMGYYDLQEGSPEQKSFLETVAAPEVGEFLRREDYGRIVDINSVKDIWARQLLGLPTLNIDIILDLMHSLTGRSFVHTEDVASMWETQRSSQFLFERGLYDRAELIVSKKNLDLFHFEHLSEERFGEVRMIFMDQTPDKEAELKRQFILLLNAGRKNDPRNKRDLPPVEQNCKKIRFFGLTSKQSEKHKEVLSQLRMRGPASRPLEAYWSFETHAGLQIGFVGVAGNNFDNTRNLNLEDSLKKADLFNQLWKEIDDSHKS